MISRMEGATVASPGEILKGAENHGIRQPITVQ